jgi:hypothetical protein
MTSAVIPFANLQESGLDVLGGSSPSAMNVILDAKGVVRKRPGVGASSLATSAVFNAAGIDGVYATLDGRILAIGTGGAERVIYAVTPGAASAIGAGLPPQGLRGADRPIFAETELLVVIAGGREIEKFVKNGAATDRLGGTPPIATHVVGLSNRLLANDVQTDRTKVRFSDVALGDTDYSGHELWSLGGVGTSGYFTAESRPDNVVALAENTGEVFVFGQGTLQTFAPDAVTTYAPVASLEIGCGAPYSIVKVDSQFYWIDNKRRIVKSNGRSYEVVSDQIQRTLDGMPTVADAFGYHVSVGFLDAMVWTFPTDGRTFVLQKGIGWGQWSGWDGENWSRFIVNAACFTPTDGIVLVGTTTGKVGEISLDTHSDFDTQIQAEVITGYINRDTDARKHCKRVRLSLRRGEAGTTPGPQAYLRWRDRNGPWEGEIPVDLGSSGDREIVVEYPSLGVYRFRQWGFELSGTDELALVSATEEFDVLSS